MIALRPRPAAVLAYSYSRSGVRWADTTRISNGTFSSERTSAANFSVGQSDRLPMMIPIRGRVEDLKTGMSLKRASRSKRRIIGIDIFQESALHHYALICLRGKFYPDRFAFRGRVNGFGRSQQSGLKRLAGGRDTDHGGRTHDNQWPSRG